MKTIFNFLLWLIFGTIRPCARHTYAMSGGGVVPMIVLIWRTSWLAKPSAVYMDAITSVVLFDKIDNALKSWDKRSPVTISFKTKGLQEFTIPADFVRYAHKAMAVEAEEIMKAMEQYDSMVSQLPEELRSKLSPDHHPREILKKLHLVEAGVLDPAKVVVAQAPNTIQ